MFHRGAILPISFVLVSLLLFSCAPRPTIREDRARESISAPDPIRKLFTTALDEYKEGEWEKSTKHFQEFITQYPHTSLTDDALYYVGEIYLQKGEYSAAAVQFESLMRHFPSSPKYQEAQWSLSNCYFNMGRYEDALKTALGLLPTINIRALWRGRLFILIGDCYAALKDPMAALSWYTRARREVPSEEREGIRDKIVALLDQDLNADTYREIEIVYRGTFIARYARYKLAQWYFHKGNFKEASDLLRETLKESSAEVFYPLMEDLWREIQKSATKEVVIGCILPLQGRAKPFGMKALKGIELAMGAFRPQQWPFKVRLIIWDSGGEPSLAKEGVKALATQGVVAIIGPLLSHTSIAAATEAEAQKVPLMTLSPLSGIAKKGRYIFQNSLTYSSQVEALVKYAFNELGIVTYAILYPRNSYGMTFKKLFQQEVESYGGTLVVAASYTDAQTDFGDVIKEMVEYLPTKNPEEEPKPIINFGAIFIPDDFKKIRLIVPQLAYYNITNVQLLGTNGWDSPELVRRSGEFVEGALFVDGFFKDSPLPWIRYFVGDFEETFGLSPTLLEALSFDSTDIILKAIGNQGPWSREVLNESLLSLKEFVGITGLIGFNQDGEAVRKLFLLTVSNGIIHQISLRE